MKQEELKEFLSNFGYEETVVFEDPSYDTACVGLTDDGRAVYDYDKMIEHLMEVDVWMRTKPLTLYHTTPYARFRMFKIHPLS